MRQLPSVVGVGALAGAIVGAAAVAALRAGAGAGNLAEWFQGVGTVGALLVTYLLLRHELATRRAERERDTRDQATKVSAWVDDLPRQTAGGETIVGVNVQNASSSPIFGCCVRVDGAKMDMGMIPADRTITRWHAGEVREPTRLDVGFSDSSLNHWVRLHRGQLVRISVPANAIIVGGPQAFDEADQQIDPERPFAQPQA